MMKKFGLVLLAALVCCGATQADIINVDFDDSRASFGTYSGAAIIGAAGDVWNSCMPELDFGGYAGGTYTALQDSTGVATSVSLILTASGSGWGTTNNTDCNFGDPLNSLMRDSAFAFPGAVGTATISGLAPNAAYTIYLLGVSNSAAQNTTFTIDGVAKTVASDTIADATYLTEGEDYVVFTGDTGAAGEIVLTYDGGGNFCSFNGFQLEIISNAAHDPNPDGVSLLAAGDVPDPLTWLSPDNPDEPNIIDVTAYDVYFYGVLAGSVTADDPNFADVTPVSGTVNNPTGGFIAQSSLPETITDNTTYFWRVDSTVVFDSNEMLAPGTYTQVAGGYEVVLPGFVWSFTTLASYYPPVITMDSVITAIDLVPATLSAAVNGNTDPLNTPVFTLLTDDIDYPAGAVASVTNTTTVNTNPTATLITDTPGTYKVKLVVSDGITDVEEVVEVVVYADTCDAQKNAPSRWTQNPYDFDGNCVVDLLDFAEVAAVWLDDTGMDVQETYPASVIYVPVTASSIIFEAESFTAVSEGPGIEDPNPAGTVNVGFIGADDWMEYALDVEGIVYDFRVSSSSPSGSDYLQFGTDVDPVLYGTTGTIPGTGAWHDYQISEHLGVVDFTSLGAGTHTITLRITSAGGINLDYFILDPQ